MAQSTKRSLQQNPFTAYREPDTGQWVIIQHTSRSEQSASDQASQSSSDNN